MPTVLAYLHPAAERQQGEQGAVLSLSRSATGFRLRATCGENGRVIGRWVGDCPRTVTEIGLGWLTSYSWNVSVADDSPLNVNEALNLPELQSTPGHVQDIVDALQQNFPPKDPVVPETGARVRLAQRSEVPTAKAEPEAIDPERVERLLARARAKLAEGADPERITKRVATLLSTSVAEAWYVLKPPGLIEDEEEEEEEEVEPPPRKRRPQRAHVVPDAPASRPRLEDLVSKHPRLQKRPLRPLGREEIPEELSEEQARFLRSAGANPGDYEKMQRTHRRAQQMHEVAEATTRRNAQIDAAVARRRERVASEQVEEPAASRRRPAAHTLAEEEAEPRRRRSRREEEEAAAMLAAAEADLDAEEEDENLEDETEEEDFEDEELDDEEDEELDDEEDEELDDEEDEEEDEEIDDEEEDEEDEELDDEEDEEDEDLDDEEDEELEDEGGDSDEEPEAQGDTNPTLEEATVLVQEAMSQIPPEEADAPSTRGRRQKPEARDDTPPSRRRGRQRPPAQE